MVRKQVAGTVEFPGGASAGPAAFPDRFPGQDSPTLRMNSPPDIKVPWGSDERPGTEPTQ